MITFIASPSYRTGKSIECETTARQELDRRALELHGFGVDGYKFPESFQEIREEYCPKVKAASSCIHHYAYTCLKPLPRQLVKLFVADNKTAADACQSSSDVVEDRVIPYFKCLNRALPNLNECVKKTAHALNHINYHVAGINSEKRFAYTCREYHDLNACFTGSVRSCCSDQVQEIARAYFDRTTHSTSGFLCRFYSKESVKDLPPLDLAHGFAESSSGYKHDYQSILSGLVDLYQRANEEVIDAKVQVV